MAFEVRNEVTRQKKSVQCEGALSRKRVVGRSGAGEANAPVRVLSKQRLHLDLLGAELDLARAQR
jgi:hypothetical protein